MCCIMNRRSFRGCGAGDPLREGSDIAAQRHGDHAERARLGSAPVQSCCFAAGMIRYPSNAIAPFAQQLTYTLPDARCPGLPAWQQSASYRPEFKIARRHVVSVYCPRLFHFKSLAM